MEQCQYITLREKTDIMNAAAEWFHNKWGIPTEAYLECIRSYLHEETEYGCRRFAFKRYFSRVFAY